MENGEGAGRIFGVHTRNSSAEPLARRLATGTVGQRSERSGVGLAETLLVARGARPWQQPVVGASALVAVRQLEPRRRRLHRTLVRTASDAAHRVAVAARRAEAGGHEAQRDR